MSARIRPADRIYPGYVLDLDGTVYLGGAPLPGAVEAISRLRALGSRFVFLSNNTEYQEDNNGSRNQKRGKKKKDSTFTTTGIRRTHAQHSRSGAAKVLS